MHSVGKGHVFKRTLETDVEADYHDLQAPASQQAHGLPPEQHTTSETLLCADSDYGTVWNVAELQAQLDLDHVPEQAASSRQANLAQMNPSNE